MAIIFRTITGQGFQLSASSPAFHGAQELLQTGSWLPPAQLTSSKKRVGAAFEEAIWVLRSVSPAGTLAGLAVADPPTASSF